MLPCCCTKGGHSAEHLERPADTVQLPRRPTQVPALASAPVTPGPTAATAPTDSNPASKGSFASAAALPPKYRPAV